ncbi:hypothetical protein GE107_06340 [Cohnella sp. CFH 77786]|uniref:hypothetical protein n=1 Tax=Cohnella sp. CFH 77786 TaxID=2662265 RepID=UPI001C61091B|nr:hypothetical protein [Cohnella sp. CFH 77786]MBW5445683.1 hypothetical protein [Cohnella sp. CFH 77786]
MSASTSAGDKSANVINQGWNVWQPFSVEGIAVTDGTISIAFCRLLGLSRSRRVDANGTSGLECERNSLNFTPLTGEVATPA